MLRPTGRHDGPAFLPAGGVLEAGSKLGAVEINELSARPTRGSLLETLLETRLRGLLNASEAECAETNWQLEHRWERMRLRHLQLRRRLMFECEQQPHLQVNHCATFCVDGPSYDRP